MMKREFDIDDRAALDAALNDLRIHNGQALFIPLEDSDLSEIQDIIGEYFKAEEGSEEATALEKVISAAAARAARDNPDVPDKYKFAVATRTSKEFLGLLKYEKIGYRYNIGDFGVGLKAEETRITLQQQNASMKGFNVVERLIKNVENYVKKGTVKKFIADTIDNVTENETVSKIAKRLSSFAISIVPEEVRVEFEKKAINTLEKASNIINDSVARLADTSVGKKVKAFVGEYVQPLVDVGVENVKRVYSKVKEKVKSLWTRAKSTVTAWLRG